MAWTAPRTWVTGEVVTASMMNTHLRDNMNALRNPGHFHAGTTDWEAWYPCGQITNDDPSSDVTTANLLYGIPFRPRLGGTLDRIAFEVTTAAAGNARVGIYATKGATNFYPGSLVVDGGEISTSTTGVKSATISTALTDYLYWAMFLCSVSTVSIRSLPQGCVEAGLGLASTLGGAYPVVMKVSQSYGALPSTFPASGVREPGGLPPLIAVRYSA